MGLGMKGRAGIGRLLRHEGPAADRAWEINEGGPCLERSGRTDRPDRTGTGRTWKMRAAIGWIGWIGPDRTGVVLGVSDSGLGKSRAGTRAEGQGSD